MCFYMVNHMFNSSIFHVPEGNIISYDMKAQKLNGFLGLIKTNMEHKDLSKLGMVKPIFHPPLFSASQKHLFPVKIQASLHSKARLGAFVLCKVHWNRSCSWRERALTCLAMATVLVAAHNPPPLWHDQVVERWVQRCTTCSVTHLLLPPRLGHIWENPGQRVESWGLELIPKTMPMSASGIILRKNSRPQVELQLVQPRHHPAWMGSGKGEEGSHHAAALTIINPFPWQCQCEFATIDTVQQLSVLSPFL